DGIRDFHVTGVQTVLFRSVVLRAMGVEGLAADAMEVPGVFLERVVGRQVHASAEPKYIACAATLRRKREKDAHVHVHRRDVGVRSEERRVGTECGGRWRRM